MVGEFPELQGIMGRYYALAQGEPMAIANAIADHYKPIGPTDLVPGEPVAIAVALADKLDTLTGFFSIEEKPTGRRTRSRSVARHLALSAWILENKLRLPLREVLSVAYRGVTMALLALATACRSRYPRI